MKSAMIRLEDRIQISERIREIRLNAELLQYEFGERLGVGRVTVCRWENWAQLPPMKKLEEWQKNSTLHLNGYCTEVMRYE